MACVLIEFEQVVFMTRQCFVCLVCVEQTHFFSLGHVHSSSVHCSGGFSFERTALTCVRSFFFSSSPFCFLYNSFCFCLALLFRIIAIASISMQWFPVPAQNPAVKRLPWSSFFCAVSRRRLSHVDMSTPASTSRWYFSSKNKSKASPATPSVVFKL
jgi:hypothetical protein